MAIAGQRRVAPVLFSIAGIVVILLIVFGVRYFTHEAVAVRTAHPTNQNLLKTVATTGKVEPVDEFQAHAPYAGVIDQIYVEVGQVVKPGTPLLKMADSDVVARVSTAQAALKSNELTRDDMAHNGSSEERLRCTSDVDSAKADKAEADRSLARDQQLLQKGAASAGEVATDRLHVDSAQRALDAVQQRCTARYGKNEIERADIQLSDARTSLSAAKSAYNSANITSPIAGTVYAIPVSQYDFVPGGDDLLDVADLNRIQVRAYFDEPEIGQLERGQPAKIVWDAKPGAQWHGHIERAPTTVIAYGTRNVGECLITIDDAKGDLLPNTNVTVTVTTSERKNVLSVPREALHTDGPANYVYRIIANKLVRTPVQVGVLNLVRVEITGGLSEQDVVALSATSNIELKNGLAVKPTE